MVKPTIGNAQRSYIDIHHHSFPHLPLFTYGVPAFLGITWLFWLSCGSLLWKSNRDWKTNQSRGWKRLLGTGYKWSTEFGPMITTIYCNLPDRAE